MADSSDPAAELIDVTGLDLDQLTELPDNVLHATLRRILAETAARSDQFAAFQNAL